MPEGLDWKILTSRDGDEIKVHYLHVLEKPESPFWQSRRHPGLLEWYLLFSKLPTCPFPGGMQISDVILRLHTGQEKAPGFLAPEVLTGVLSLG